ncbi:MAG: FtsX-like permease family protein [Candidatus Binatus sp.]|jgi:putative ABC transport system permease protein|uniref:ABC transporter permease n=1 Tax=Candidatus Binatus sp. TaxID=2811406 RepID=UPI003D0C996D
MKYAALVLKNLLRSKRRTILTVVSIAVSLFIFSALVSVPTAANQILSDTASSTRIATHNKAGLAYPIPEAYKQRIMSVPHVEVVLAESWFGGVYHEVYDEFPNLAVDPEQADLMWPDYGISKEQFEQFKKIRTACLVGGDTMKRFHLHLGQQIQLRGTLYPFNVTLNIVGTFSGKAPPNFLLFRRDYLEEAAGRPGMVDNIWVKIDKPENVPQVIAAIDEGFANSSAETLSESEAAFIGSFMDQYRTFFRMAELLGFIVVLMIGLVAANTAAMSIRERRGEIAVMRSIGFPSRTILSMLLAESILIGLAGGIIGCGAAYIVLKVFSVGNAAGPLGSIHMQPAIATETLVVAALIGLFSALVPASSAARRNIVDALRTVA